MQEGIDLLFCQYKFSTCAHAFIKMNLDKAKLNVKRDGSARNLTSQTAPGGCANALLGVLESVGRFSAQNLRWMQGAPTQLQGLHP